MTRVLDIVADWRRTAKTVVPIATAVAAEQFIEYKYREKLNLGTKHDINRRLRCFARWFGDRNLNELGAANIDDFLHSKTEGWDRRSFWKRLRPFFDYCLMHR